MAASTLPWWLRTKTLLWTLGLGLAVRIALVSAIPVFPIIANTWDSTFYHETATALSRGEGYSFQGKPTAFFPPGFSTALAPSYALLGADPRSGQITNLLLSLVLGCLGVLTARMMGGQVAARWACLWFALEPSQMMMPAFLMSEVLCGALIMGILWMSIRVAGVPGALVAGVFGLAAGMTRGHGFLVLPAVVVVLWWLERKRRGAYLRAFVLITLVAGAGVTVWASRNQEQLNHPVWIATNGGINLLLGNNPNARGGRADPPGGVPQTGDEVHDEALARERAVQYMKEHPLRTLGLLPLKAARLWAFGPSLTYREELRAKLPRAAAQTAIVLAQVSHVLLLVLLGLALWKRRGPPVLWAVLVVWTLGHLPFLGGARYLFPVHGALIVLASCFLSLRKAPLRPGG